MTEPISKEQADEAYDKIDRYLRNNLDDADYAEYSEALERVYAYGVSPSDGEVKRCHPPMGDN